MPIKYVSGDLFLTEAQTLAHGCNCRGRMGAGVAREFKARFPGMFKEYRRRCHSGEFQTGGYYLEKKTTPWVLNLATQADLGGATLEYVSACFAAVAANFEEEGITSLAMPRIAAGLGHLEWDDVIEEHLGVLPIPVIVYEKFISGVAADEA